MFYTVKKTGKRVYQASAPMRPDGTKDTQYTPVVFPPQQHGHKARVEWVNNGRLRPDEGWRS